MTYGDLTKEQQHYLRRGPGWYLILMREDEVMRLDVSPQVWAYLDAAVDPALHITNEQLKAAARRVLA